LVLSLDGQWLECTVTWCDERLWIGGAIIKGGMSGSPIVSRDGRAVPSTLAGIAIMHGQCGFLIEIKCRACLQLYRLKQVVVPATMRKGVLHGYP
jgi:hypothetical protein